MKNTLIILLAIISISIISCKKEDNIEIIRMRVNHYQQPVNNWELFNGLAFIVQEDDEIGNDKWYGFSHIISGFDYELGYVYDIEVQEKQIGGDPMLDMPNVEYSLIRILSKTKVPQETTFDITLTIKYSNGFESLVDNKTSKFSLLGGTEIDCGDLCDYLEEKIKNQTGLVGTFTHIDDKTIRLINLKTQE